MLQQLGFNWTFFIQFGLFIFTISFLALYVFKPYNEASKSREQQTKGSEEIATDLEKKSLELYTQYEKKAREVNFQIQDVYRLARQQVATENEKVISNARLEATRVIEENRKKIKEIVTSVKASLRTEIPQIVQALTQKLLGKS
jgi:F-type H+-transporting ATPase subunit b